MKKLLIVAVLALLATGVNAQAKKAQPNHPATKAVAKTQSSEKNFITRMKGNMVMMKGAEMIPMQEEMKFSNGNLLMSDGTFVYNNGTQKMMLEEGQKIDMNGVLIEAKSDQMMHDSEKPVAKPASAEPEKLN